MKINMCNVCVNNINKWKCANIKQHSVLCVYVCTPGALTNGCFNYPLFFILDIKRTCMNEEYVNEYWRATFFFVGM